MSGTTKLEPCGFVDDDGEYHGASLRGSVYSAEQVRAAIDKLTAERDALKRDFEAALRSRNEWIAENARGGWIDDLRNRVGSLEIQRDAAVADARRLREAQSAQATVHAPQRLNIERDGDDLLVCFGEHDKSDACTYERFVPQSAQAPAQPSVDRKINMRKAEALLEEIMAQCEAIGYDKGLADAAQPAQAPAHQRIGHVGDSQFESWFASYSPSGEGDKQRARDAYAAGMGDAFAQAPAQPAPSVEAVKPNPDDMLTVANITVDGGNTLTLLAGDLGNLIDIVGEDEETYNVTITAMRRDDFEALGEFDGF